MNDELTKVDIEKMKAELEDRLLNIRAKIMEDVKTARAFGDLSENYEYKAAKEAQRRNDSRMRYLERMIATAKVIDAPKTADDEVGLFSTVTMFNEKLQKEQTIRIVTTLRQDALHGLISKESPVARALMGHRAGERVEIAVSPEMKYTVEIRSVEPGTDDASLAISSF